MADMNDDDPYSGSEEDNMYNQQELQLAISKYQKKKLRQRTKTKGA